MRLYENQIPNKLVLRHNKTGKQTTFYSYDTLYLDFMDSVFTVVFPENFIPYGTRQANPETVNSRPQAQMQIL